MAVGMNLALRLKRLPDLSLANTMAIIIAIVLLAIDVASIAIRFFHGLNLLFDAAAAPAPADLFDFLLKKLLLIFFFAFQPIALH